MVFILSLSPSPRERLINAHPPTPNRLPTAIVSRKSGVEMLTAATWFASPVCPTKNVSARLYIIFISIPSTLGIASVATAFGILYSLKTSVLSLIFLAAIVSYKVNYKDSQSPPL